MLTRKLYSQNWPSSTWRGWRPMNQHIRCPAGTSAALGTDTQPRHTQHQRGATVCFLRLEDIFNLISCLNGWEKVDHIRNERQNVQTGPSSDRLSNAHTPVVPKVRQSWKTSIITNLFSQPKHIYWTGNNTILCPVLVAWHHLYDVTVYIEYIFMQALSIKH